MIPFDLLPNADFAYGLIRRRKQMEIFIASVLFPLTCLFPGKSKEVSLEKQDLSLFFCPRFTGRIT